MKELYNQNNTSLEPRVAKLEVSLDRLTEDVRSLALVVRDQGANVEKQLTELTVAVTQASGPKKTDWSLIISTVLLIMAIGSAAFWPLNQTVQENKIGLNELNQTFHNHSSLPLHPVGQVLIQKTEERLKDYIETNKRETDVIEKNLFKQIENLQRINELELEALKDKVTLHDDRLYGRVVKLEDEGRIEIERLKDELQMWRLQSMGVTTSPSVSTHSHEETKQESNKK